MSLSSRLEPILAGNFIRYQPSGTDKTQSRDAAGRRVSCGGRRTFHSSLRDLIRQSMQRTCSLSLTVRPHTSDITMDHRLKPGGDEVGSVSFCVEYRVAGFAPDVTTFLQARDPFAIVRKMKRGA